MRRIALFSLVPVAVVAAVLAVRAVGVSRCGLSAAMAGSSCAAPQSEAATSSHTATKAAHGKDPLMALVCERSCAAKTPYREEMVIAQPGAKEGDLARCPVSGVVFSVTVDNPDVAYQGMHYRLCCGTCEKKFRARPAHFVG